MTVKEKKKWYCEPVKIEWHTLVLAGVLFTAFITAVGRFDFQTDKIEALTTLVSVFVAGYGIFMTNHIAGKNTRIKNLEKTLQKQKDYVEVYKWMERAIVEHKIQNRNLKVDDKFHKNSQVYGTQKNNLQNYVRKYADDYDLQFPRNPKRK